MIETYSFRGHSYRAEENISFEDEATVREAFWGVGEGDCVFDVGASYGSYSLTGLAAGAKQVFAWEPIRAPHGLLYNDTFKTNILLNGWNKKTLLYEHGLGDRERPMVITNYYPPGCTEVYEYTFEVEPMDSWYRKVFVPIFGDERYKRYWMKIDVEGAELDVLRGAEKLIKELHPHLLVETHPFINAMLPQATIELVRSFGGYEQVYSAPYGSVGHSLFVPNGSEFMPGQVSSSAPP